MYEFAGSSDYSGDNAEAILVASACRYMLDGRKQYYEHTYKLLKARFPGSKYVQQLGAQNFEVACTKCKGAKKIEKTCVKCGGSGSCKACGGVGTRESLMGGKLARRTHCTTCKGTGRCSSCQGTGRISTICSKCRGDGRIASQELLKKEYESCLAAVVGDYEQTALAKRQKEDSLAADDARRLEEDRRLTETKVKVAQAETLLELERIKTRQKETERKSAEMLAQAKARRAEDERKTLGVLALKKEQQLGLNNAEKEAEVSVHQNESIAKSSEDTPRVNPELTSHEAELLARQYDAEYRNAIIQCAKQL